MNNENNFNNEPFENGSEEQQELYFQPDYDTDNIISEEPEQEYEPEQEIPDAPVYISAPEQEYTAPQQQEYTAPRQQEYIVPQQQIAPQPEEPIVQNDVASASYTNPYQDNSQSFMRSAPYKEPEQFNPYAPANNNQQNSRTYHYSPSQPYGAPQEPSPQNGKNSGGMKVAIGVIIACVVIAVAVIALSLGGSGDKNTANSTEPSSTTSAAEQIVPPATTGADSGVALQTTSPQSTNNGAVWVAEKVRPSVVGVMVYKNGQLAGEGSGILMSEKDGYTNVVTCAHVVDADNVTYGIMLLDGTRYEAKLVASDTRTDIAVIKVQKTGLPLAEFGDSSSLKIGETIYAVGNPGGSEYFGSITDGIVSAIDRSISATYTMTCIQHNAAINPGNSGGALVNSQGQVIGINSSKIASTEFEGMGFAVPTAIAKPVVDALIQHGYVPNRPKLGIEYAPVSSYQLYSMVVSIKGLPKDSLVIAGISEDSSLVNTQAQVGDLIIGVNGKKMDDSSVLLDLIDTGAVGDTLTLNLCRIESKTYKTTTFDVTITLVEDKGKSDEEPTTQPEAHDGYYYGGSESFEDFFNDYFGEFGW